MIFLSSVPHELQCKRALRATLVVSLPLGVLLTPACIGHFVRPTRLGPRWSLFPLLLRGDL